MTKNEKNRKEKLILKDLTYYRASQVELVVKKSSNMVRDR